jgi:hypothetical protein
MNVNWIIDRYLLPSDSVIDCLPVTGITEFFLVNSFDFIYSEILIIFSWTTFDVLKTSILEFKTKFAFYRKVISLEIQVGITSQINKWANMDPRNYRRWNQVPGRSKYPFPTGRTRCEPNSIIMNAELSTVKVSVSSTV